jgi:hypothetical protein
VQIRNDGKSVYALGSIPERPHAGDRAMKTINPNWQFLGDPGGRHPWGSHRSRSDARARRR